MHSPKCSPEHVERLAGREAQTRGWAAPLPNIFDRIDGARQRLEWGTRDTINNRLWADTITAGPALARGSVAAADTMLPSASRSDNRPYAVSGPAYFASAPASSGERPTLPPQSLYQNPWSSGFNVGAGDVGKELRGVVKEDRDIDVSNRLVGRTFEHQWVPEEATRAIAERKIDASELLRPAQDDYRTSYLSTR